MDAKTKATLDQFANMLAQANSTIAVLCGEIAERDERISALIKQIDELTPVAESA